MILKYRFPVHVLTKSTLVLRDIDILKEIDEKARLPSDLENKLNHRAIVNFSISTLDVKIAKILEPGAPSPIERLEAMKKISDIGLLTGVSYIPILPYLSDSEKQLEEMIKTARDYNAKFIFVGTLTLFGNEPQDSRILYFRFIEKYYPKLLPKYKALYMRSFQPPKNYQNKMFKTVKLISEKYGVKLGLK